MKYRGELFGTPPTTSRTNLIQDAPKPQPLVVLAPFSLRMCKAVDQIRRGHTPYIGGRALRERESLKLSKMDRNVSPTYGDLLAWVSIT